MRVFAAFPIALAALAACGCGSSDDATFDLDVRFTISTSDAEWRQPPAGGVPNWVCEGRAALVSDCCQTPSGESLDCGQYPLRCDVDGFCALAFEHHVKRTVDLDGVPQLQAFRGRTMTGATLDEFVVKAEDATLPIRTMDLHVGAPGTRVDQAGSVRLASFTPPADLSEVRVRLSAEARAALSRFIVDVRSPFEMTLVSHVVVPRGQGGSVGAMGVDLTGKIDARY